MELGVRWWVKMRGAARTVPSILLLVVMRDLQMRARSSLMSPCIRTMIRHSLTRWPCMSRPHHANSCSSLFNLNQLWLVCMDRISSKNAGASTLRVDI